MFCRSQVTSGLLRLRTNLSVQRATSNRCSSQMNYEALLTAISKRREPSVLRELTKLTLQAPEGTVSLATGMPNPEIFPFQDITITLRNGDKLTLEGKELDNALQYQPSSGYTPLKLQLQDMLSKVHGLLDWNNRDILISSGSMDGISRAIEMLLNVGDPVVIQHPLYSGVENMFRTYQPLYILAEQDEDGVDPLALRRALEIHRRQGGKMPKVFYLNPTGANPTGTTLTLERKKALYKLAQDYDLIILEDDAYYYLHFLDADPVSLLSLDTDGRVLRFDTFSKILSSGLRLGIVTGPQPLIRRIELHMQSTTLHAASISQVIAHKLLHAWGHKNFEEHLTQVRAFYKSRRDIMVAAAEEHLKGLAEWSVPSGGMFLWIKVCGVQDTNAMVMERGLEQKILLAPGRCFAAHSNEPCPYIRVSYSMASSADINEGMSRLASLIRNEQQLTKHR